MLRTMLTVRKHCQDGKVRVVHKDWSRSFTRHFMTGLYVSHGQVLAAAGIARTDITGDTMLLVDGDNAAGINAPKHDLRINGPSGWGAIEVNSGKQGGGNAQGPWGYAIYPGHLMGIQIGASNTAVTPADWRMGSRIGHGRNASVGVAAVIDSFVNDNADANYTVTNGQAGIWYLPLRDFDLTAITFKLWRTNNPGNIVIKIFKVYMVSANNYNVNNSVPIATSNIVNGNLWGNASPGAEVQFDFATPVHLHAGQRYSISISPMQAAAANYVNFRYNNGAYPAGGNRFSLTNINAAVPGSFVVSGTVSMFAKLTGTANAEMEYGGNDLYGYTIANPNGSFNIRRIFENNSGEAITVKESGIYAPLTRYISGTNIEDEGLANFYLIAHDTFADVAVLNTESLEVTYTPSITV